MIMEIVLFKIKRIKKRMTAFVCLFVVLAAGPVFSQNWEKGPLEDAVAKAKASGKLIVLDFFQEYG
jgi:hypothetical protein